MTYSFRQNMQGQPFSKKPLTWWTRRRSIVKATPSDWFIRITLTVVMLVAYHDVFLYLFGPTPYHGFMAVIFWATCAAIVTIPYDMLFPLILFCLWGLVLHLAMAHI